MRMSDWSSDVCSSDLEDLVVHFEADSYNHNASIAENLLFGTPRVPSFASGALARNATVATVLRAEGLLEDFVQMGVTIAQTMRLEERRVGEECSRTCRSRWSPNH